MGQMSDYDIRPKPKVWAVSCQTSVERLAELRPNVVCSFLMSALSGQEMSQ